MPQKTAAQNESERRCGLRGYFGLGAGFGSFRFKSRLGPGYDGGKRGGIGDGEICEDLAVGFDTGGFQTFDEARVGHFLRTDGSVDTLCPEATELSFTPFPVAILVSLRLADCVLGVTEEFGAETAETLGTEQDALAASPAGRGIGGTWHVLFSVGTGRLFSFLPQSHLFVSPV